MLKRFLFYGFSCFILFLVLPSPSSFAQEFLKLVEENSKRIEELKIPDDYLENLDPIILEDILNNDELIEFESSSTYQWSESNQKLELISITDQRGTEILISETVTDNGDISMQGTIPSDKFTIYIDIYNVTSSDGRKRKDIYARYEWHSAPWWLLKDPFGISWSSNWRAVDNTSRNVDYYKSGNTWVVVDDTTAIAYSGEGGIGWHADLYTWAVYDSTQLQGFGKVRIETKSTNNPSGSDQLHVNYGHKMGTGTLGLTFGFISVNVTGSASHDTRGNYKTFSY